VSIVVYDMFYSMICVAFTHLENHKFQHEYDTSLNAKTLAFKFVNSYFSIFFASFY